MKLSLLRGFPEPPPGLCQLTWTAAIVHSFLHFNTYHTTLWPSHADSWLLFDYDTKNWANWTQTAHANQEAQLTSRLQGSLRGFQLDLMHPLRLLLTSAEEIPTSIVISIPLGKLQQTFTGNAACIFSCLLRKSPRRE